MASLCSSGQARADHRARQTPGPLANERFLTPDAGPTVTGSIAGNDSVSWYVGIHNRMIDRGNIIALQRV